MRLYQQLVLFMLAATVLPMAGLGFSLLASTEAEVARRIRSEQEALARAAAVEVASTLMDAVESIGRSAELLQWEALEAAEQQGALTLLYEQSPLVSAVLRVDARGTPLGSAVARAVPAAGHPGFGEGAEHALLQAVPVQALVQGPKGQVALSAPFEIAGGGGRAVALAVKLEEGLQGSYAVVQVHLAPLAQVLTRVVGPAHRAWLTDAAGGVVASGEGTDGALPEDARAALRGEVGTGAWLVSAVPLSARLGLSTVVAAETAQAFAPVRGLRRSVLWSLGLGLAVLLGVGALFTRRLNGRLGALATGAEALGRGALSTRIALKGSDELTDVAAAFNRMGAELEGARAQLLGFNDELKARVEAATAELKASQAQLLEAQKLAAVGQLGAGVAHEINNPLAGILGHAQILLLEKPEGDPDIQSLRKIEQAARRVKEITANLLRFSQQRQVPAMRPMDLRGPVREALGLTGNQLQAEQITLELALPDSPVRVDADPGHLSQVLLALMQNARTAMVRSERKVLRLVVETDGTEALLIVQDTGRGITPEHLPRIFEPFFTTKDVWSNVGLGLSVSFRVVREHGGTVAVETAPGEGSRFTVRLPLLG